MSHVVVGCRRGLRNVFPGCRLLPVEKLRGHVRQDHRERPGYLKLPDAKHGDNGIDIRRQPCNAIPGNL